jgi:hypothetical protein
MEESLIETLHLSDEQVWGIVKEWYINGMYPEVIQNSAGMDLEEICEYYIETLNF